MSNKSNRSLTAGIIILVLLAVIVTLRYTVFKTKSERNFNGIVNELPIEAVDRIEIKLPGEQLVVLNRADDIWTVTKNDTTFKADANTIHAVLEQTTNMTPLRIAALNKERWEELELTPDKGTVVRYYSGKKTLADFSIGKYEYYEKMQSGQQRGDMSTYVRENDGETVYAVRGFLKTLFRANSDYYRNHAFYPPINKEDITEVTYITPDSLNLNYKLTKESDGWIINGMSVDSAAVVTFFNKIVRASSGRFVTAIPDNIYPETCTIKGNNMAAIEVRLYPAEGGFIITSTYDDDGIFFDKDGTMRNRYLSIINRQ